MTRRVCRKCRRPLRSPLWRARGIGPVCARRAGLVRSRQCVTVLVWSARTVASVDGQLALFEFGEAGKGVAQPL